MGEDLRLAISLSCPKCSLLIKPLIMQRKYVNKILRRIDFKCPVAECGHEWSRRPEEIAENTD